MNDFKVEIISRHPIKPSSPTPQTLKNFKLSLLDQLVPPIYAATIFFYSNNENSSPMAKTLPEISQSLQHSLSETLTLFYPMAGQIKGSLSVDCTDEGAIFFEARAHCDLTCVLSQPSPELLNRFLPIDEETVESCSGAVMLVQLSGFECGGVAISVCICHKMGDVSTLCTFLKCWTAISRGDDGEGYLPQFVGGSLLPPRDMPAMPDMGVAIGKCITRRMVFDGSKIASLKNKITGPNAKKQPSRVESVVALILKCAISASRSISISGTLTPAIFFQTVNLRNRMNPPLSENSVGNLVWPFPVFVEEGEEMELHELTDKMRKGMMDFCNEKAHKFKGDEGFEEIMSSLAEWSAQTNKDIYRCSSWCRAPVYETDFGWGKPVWVSSASQDMRNIIVLVDTKDGEGIEAWLTLDEQEMALFECDQELLEFACFNPSVLS